MTGKKGVVVNMKQKIIKRMTAIASIGLTGLLVFFTVRNDALTVSAKETLPGIETLRKEVQDRNAPYRILEVVPDEEAAEIGYYIGGQEPALSQRQAGTGVWSSWQEGMKQCATAEERAAYVEALRLELEAFYSARGFAGDNVPVGYQPYEESEEALEGYAQLSLGEEEWKGYFESAGAAAGGERYRLNFTYMGETADLNGVTLETQYYGIESVKQIDSGMFDQLTDRTDIFSLISANGVQRFERIGVWGDLKETVSGGNAGIAVNGAGTAVNSAGTPADSTSAGTTASGAGTTADSTSTGTAAVGMSTPAVSGGNAGGDSTGTGSPKTGGTGADAPAAGGTGAPSTGAAAVTTDYYLVTFAKWQQGATPASGYNSLYVAQSAEKSSEGEYLFVKDENGFLSGLTAESIYYKGGFVSNEWFKSGVLNLEPEETDGFPVEVLTLTVSELNDMGAAKALPEFDMLYVNSGMQKFANNPVKLYSADNDLSGEVRDALFSRTVGNGRPCIVDAQIVYLQEKNDQGEFKVNEALQSTNIFSLCAMFLQKSPMQYYTGHENNHASAVELLQGVVEDADKNFVTEQVYSFFAPKSLVGPDFLTPDIYKNGQGVSGRENGFWSVLDEIVSENLNREADTSGAYQPLSTNVSGADVLRHIMNYQNRRQIPVKSLIRVLDLEPAKSDKDSYELTEDQVREWALGVDYAGDAADKVSVEIDRMTTAEFIGRIENVNENYDLIYIGTDRDHMNVDRDGNTVFNDASMNGLIYFHTGDLRYAGMELAGQLDSEYVGRDRNKALYYYNPVRYGGNDITPEKKEALLSFLNASYPIIVSDEFFTAASVDGSGQSVGRVINENTIDSSSYLHDFVKAAMEKSNFYSRSDIGPASGMFQFYLNRPKVDLFQVTANGTQTDSGIYELYPSADGKYTLEYHFTVVYEGAVSLNTGYKCRLYIDANSDGKFSGEEELSDIFITANGNAVSPDSLVAGKEYVLRRTVPEGYKGVLPWKIQVTQKDNANIHNSVTGYTRLMGMERESLKALQISREKLPGSKETLFNLQSRLDDPRDIYHALVYGGTYAGIYYKGIYDDFDIDVTFMTIPEFEEKYKENSDILDNYNMLILGFSDYYGDLPGTQTDGPVGAIVRFINSGKSVLLSNDTISYSNYESNKKGAISHNNPNQLKQPSGYRNAYNLTTQLRGLLGMDRYGITSYDPLKWGNDLKTSSGIWNTVQGSGKDIVYKPKTNKTEAYGLAQGYTYSVINARDVNGEVWHGNPPAGSHETYSADQTGRPGGFTNTYLNLNYGKVYYQDNRYDDGDIPADFSAAVSNPWVTQVNQGQITEYPYKLAKEFQVSQTHGPYYQLDLFADNDMDGQSDLVVWYCLGGRTDGAGNRQETVYSMSPNDVSNNYYIYNKGNVTYTSMGYSGNTSTVEEAKLFINTMIASYNAGVKEPVITTLSDGTPNADAIDSVNRYADKVNALNFDEKGKEQTGSGDYEKIYFRVNDVNFVKGNRSIAMNFYYEVKEGGTQTISYEGKEIAVKELPRWMIFNASDDNAADADNLISGNIYYFLIDKAVMGDYSSKFRVYFEAQSTITSTVNGHSSTLRTGKSYRRFDFIRVRLFDLE